MQTIDSGNILRLHSLLTSAEDIVIVTHTRPDGDAMGSSIGMYHLLKAVYSKIPRITIADPAPSNLDFLLETVDCKDILTHRHQPRETEDAITGSDLIICLDFNAFHRTDSLEGALRQSAATKILIDHHLAPDPDSFSLTFSETEISSASELLFHILMMLPAVDGNARNLPPETAAALLTGMTTDTNNFMNSVYPSTFQMASALLDAGVDRDMIIQKLYNRSKESRIRLQGHVLQDLMKITPDGVAYVVLEKDDMKRYNVEEGDTEGFVNIPLSIDRVLMSVFVKEDEDRIRVSIRSKKGISANRCAKLYFNGGGHENAAGGRLYMPDDLENIGQAAEYIERHTHIFMTEDNE